jgi:hypothetical protein
LQVLVDEHAPTAHLLRVLEICGGAGVQIWKFAFVPVRRGRPGSPLSFALPRDVEIGSTTERSNGSMDLIVRPLTPPDAANRVLEFEAGYVQSLDGTQSSEKLTTTRIEQLRSFLTAAPKARRVALDARTGTIYCDVVLVLDTLIDAGFTEIVFIGQQRR